MDSSSKNCILIVDDERTNILYLNRILSEDFEIITAKDGAKGVELANEYIPDLILLDIVMPGMDGYETLSLLKKEEKTKAIPVIFITGLTGDDNETKGLALGAEDYISKPFNDEIVRLRVRNQIKIVRQMRTIIENELTEYKNRTKLDFLSLMSHGMRTPMNAIIGMTNIALAENDAGSIHSRLKVIESSSREMMCIIDGMLDIAEINDDKTTLSCSDFNLKVMVQKVLGQINDMRRRKEQKLSVNISASLPEIVFGDMKRLSQVLYNVISNAVKFTGDQGFIMLKISAPEQNGIDVTLQFEVIDNGIGIGKENHEKIFLLFEQADEGKNRSYEGFGYGLFISKHIVELMGGRIWVESELGKGSKFAFTVKLQAAHLAV